jgi:hypothetical protein
VNLKKITLIIALVSGFGLFGQSYTPLLGNINEWQFTTCYFGCITDIYFTDGDTIVNGKTYKILDGYHYINRNLLLRENEAEKKVYLTITEPQYIEDLLLYDFSLKVGDTIEMLNPITPFPFNGGYFLLDSIITMPLADGNPYRHFYFSPTPSNVHSSENAIWIEGVGSLSMINAPGGHPDINGVGHLSCSFKNMELRYSNLDSINVCEPVHLSLTNFINDFREIQIFAQSEKNRFTLAPAENIKAITIYDLSGKKLNTFTYFAQKQIPLDLRELKPGIYILKVDQTSYKTRTFKVIIK